MRPNRANSSADRSNALWGRGSRGEHRSNALWGRGGRRAGSIMASFVVVLALAASATAAGSGGGPMFGNGKSGGFGSLKAYVSSSLLSAIQQNPRQSFDVIVTGNPNQKTHGFFQKMIQDKSGNATRERWRRQRQAGVPVDRRRAHDAHRLADPLPGEDGCGHCDPLERHGREDGLLACRRTTRSSGRGRPAPRSTG